MTDFTLYFLGYNQDTTGLSTEEKRARRLNREGILELTHNHGTESDPNFQGYANGNSDPGRGFGHIAISVDDIEKACARFESLGVRFQKKLTDGKMKNIAFILDPDGCVAFHFLPGRGTDAHMSQVLGRNRPRLPQAVHLCVRCGTISKQSECGSDRDAVYDYPQTVSVVDSISNKTYHAL